MEKQKNFICSVFVWQLYNRPLIFRIQTDYPPLVNRLKRHTSFTHIGNGINTYLHFFNSHKFALRALILYLNDILPTSLVKNPSDHEIWQSIVLKYVPQKKKSSKK